MKSLLVSFLIALCVLVNANAQSSVAHNVDDRYVQVNGCAIKEVLPDEIWISILLDESVSKTKMPLAQQERVLKSKLAECGVNVEKQLFVADMSNGFIKRNTSKTVKQFILKITDPGSVNKVYEKLSNGVVAAMDVVKTSYSKMAELKCEIRKEAMLDAKNKASELAEAINQSIGSAFYIMDNNSDRDYEPRLYGSRNMMVMDSAVAYEEEKVLDFKPIKVEYFVTVKFELKP